MLTCADAGTAAMQFYHDPAINLPNRYYTLLGNIEEYGNGKKLFIVQAAILKDSDINKGELIGLPLPTVSSIAFDPKTGELTPENIAAVLPELSMARARLLALRQAQGLEPYEPAPLPHAIPLPQIPLPRGPFAPAPRQKVIP